MTWCPADPFRATDAESKIRKRDSAALYDALDALYLSPADAFNELATTYDQRFASSPALLVEYGVTTSLLPDLSGKTAADIGCGTGRYAIELARRGARVSAIDLAPEMLAVASRKARRSGDLGGEISWRRGDLLETLPLAPGSTDLILCAMTLSFLSNIRDAVGLMAGALAPGGLLIISDYHPHGLAQARAEAAARNGNREKAPYLRFTSADGNDCRVNQFVHSVSDLWSAATAAGLILDGLAEPVADRQTAAANPSLREQSGVPLAIVACFRKP